MSRPERKAHNSHVSSGKQATEEVNTGNKELKQTEEDEEDPFDTRIKKSGCADLHYALLDCMDKHKDWRKCQEHVQAFKTCIDEKKKNFNKS